MAEPIVPANFRLRKIVLYWSTLAAVVGGVGILALEMYLKHLTAASIAWRSFHCSARELTAPFALQSTTVTQYTYPSPDIADLRAKGWLSG